MFLFCLTTQGLEELYVILIKSILFLFTDKGDLGKLFQGLLRIFIQLMGD